jgi:hypothetical protein
MKRGGTGSESLARGCLNAAAAAAPRYTEDMSIDERIQAIVESVELLLLESREHSKQLQEHSKQLQQDGENIRALARIAEIHERRLTSLKDGE